MSSKLIYADISANDLNLEDATRVKSDALPTIEKLLSGFCLHDSEGRHVTVQIRLNEFAYDKKIFKQAKASRLGDGRYLIEIGVGLLAQLSLLARAISADKSVLRARTKSVLLTSDVRKDGREKAISDFAFHYMLSFIMWHEVAHIALGHLDWLVGCSSLNAIEEMGSSDIPKDMYTAYQTLEGDADRQASIWTAAIIDSSLTANPYLRYPVLADAFFDIGYIYGALFSFLGSVDGSMDHQFSKHPKADVRLGIALSCVEDYLQRYRPDTALQLMEQLYAGGVKALRTIFHAQSSPYDLLGAANFIGENGQRIAAMKLRKMQHKMSNSSEKSFSVS